jgi:ribosomal-protein-alanine N-acetyltransferase
MIELSTSRLVIREFRPDDWQAVREYAHDPVVTRYVPWGPNTEEETRAALARMIARQGQDPRTEFDLAVTLAREQSLVGACRLFVSDPGVGQGWLGYVLRRDAWGNGYATEAARALLRFGFLRLELHRVFATCDVQNTASEKVLRKLGMRHEGLMRQDRWIRDRWRDSHLYAILEDEWRDRYVPAGGEEQQ